MVSGFHYKGAPNFCLCSAKQGCCLLGESGSDGRREELVQLGFGRCPVCVECRTSVEIF